MGTESGDLLGGRYLVGDRVGRGAMSEVRRARDLRLGRDVAIKILRGDLARDPAFRARFRREAQNAASLNHPAIVAVYDTGETTDADGTVPYIVMEYVDGGTLRDVLTAQGPLSPRRAAWIAADICEALDFSHRHGIVHRDIKPANVMLSRDGAVKVMDFGIARTVADDQATSGAMSSAPPATCPPSRPAANRSMPAPTSTPPAACSTSCSAAHHPSPAIRRWRSPPGRSARPRPRRARRSPVCPGRWTPSC